MWMDGNRYGWMGEWMDGLKQIDDWVDEWMEIYMNKLQRDGWMEDLYVLYFKHQAPSLITNKTDTINMN